MSDPAGHVPEAELHAYFDGELGPERRRAVEAHLAAHPEDALRLESYRGQDMLIRALPTIARHVPNVLYAIVGDG